MKRLLLAALLLIAPQASAGPYYSYPSANTLTGSEVFGPVLQGNIDTTVTAAQLQTLAQTILIGGLLDSNANGSGCAITLQPTSQGIPSFCIDRQAGMIQQGVGIAHQVWRLALKIVSTGTGAQALVQNNNVGMPSIQSSSNATAVGTVDCIDASLNAETWSVQAHWTAGSGVTQLTNGTPVMTSLYTAGTTSGWAVAEAHNFMQPNITFAGQTGVYCTGAIVLDVVGIGP